MTQGFITASAFLIYYVNIIILLGSFNFVSFDSDLITRSACHRLLLFVDVFYFHRRQKYNNITATYFSNR